MALPTLLYLAVSIAAIVCGFLFSGILKPGAPLILRIMIFAISVSISTLGLSGIAHIYDTWRLP